MLAQYEPNVKAIIHFFRLYGIKVTNTTVNNTLQIHPDWPSLFCFSDSLLKWNIPNAAGKIMPEAIDSLPTPFLAYIHKPENPLIVVEEVTDEAVVYYAPAKNKRLKEIKANFIDHWDGIYIIAEPGENSGEMNYSYQKKRFCFKG